MIIVVGMAVYIEIGKIGLKRSKQTEHIYYTSHNFKW